MSDVPIWRPISERLCKEGVHVMPLVETLMQTFVLVGFGGLNVNAPSFAFADTQAANEGGPMK